MGGFLFEEKKEGAGGDLRRSPLPLPHAAPVLALVERNEPGIGGATELGAQHRVLLGETPNETPELLALLDGQRELLTEEENLVGQRVALAGDHIELRLEVADVVLRPVEALLGDSEVADQSGGLRHVQGSIVTPHREREACLLELGAQGDDLGVLVADASAVGHWTSERHRSATVCQNQNLRFHRLLLPLIENYPLSGYILSPLSHFRLKA